MNNPVEIYKKVRVSLNRLNRKQRQAIGLAAVALGVSLLIAQGVRPMIDPTAYKPLLDTIAKGESNGNYNAYFGGAGNAEVRFTDMTVADVMKWQQEYIQKGAASNAVGRYQFMGTTLAGLVKQLRISPQAQFDEALQDRLAIALIERRGSLKFAQGNISREEFAANLAMEWAALPRMTGEDPHQSYYAGDGLNHARVTSDEVLNAIAKLKDS
ncbi:MAG TPA: hypothetical protein VJM46_02925 [Candidatus Saccharimonadales bacterium]|nr:hypothetical protein [Candidatus Saccharimonadales bacterium]